MCDARLRSRSPSLRLLAGARARPRAGDHAASTTQGHPVIDIVIVTAQRREENLIDVPIAVAAFNGEALERRQIDQATDLQLNVPNVSYTKTNFTGSNFQIRGIGVSSVARERRLRRRDALQLDADQESAPVRDRVLRRERVEVLRGPQGTLYGRNATGGAVNIIARKPEKDFDGNVELEAGNYGALKGKGCVNIPLGDTVAARFAGISFQRDGYTDNLVHRQRHRRSRSVGGARRAALHAERRHRHDADGQLLQGRLAPRARHETDVPSRSGRRATAACRISSRSRPATCAARSAAISASSVRCCSISPTAPLDGSFVGCAAAAGADQHRHRRQHRLDRAARPAPDIRRVRSDLRSRRDDRDAGVLARLRPADADRRSTGYQETSFLSQTDYNWTVAGLPYNGPAVAALTAAFGGVPISEIDGRAARLAGRQRPRRRHVLAQLRPVGPGSRSVVGRSCACPRSSTDR